MTLTGKQKNYLRGIAHSKNPVVAIGNKGLTDAVLNEIEISLEQHELLKIKLPGSSKSEKNTLIETVAKQSNSQVVQLIGNVGVIFRASNEAKITLPSI